MPTQKNRFEEKNVNETISELTHGTENSAPNVDLFKLAQQI